MPYTKKLIEKRPSAGNAASHIRAVLRQLPMQTMYPQLRARVEKALSEALHVLTASVDYDDDGTMLGVVGEYEDASHQDPNYVGWGCRGLGLDHRWQKSEFSDLVFCTKCGEQKLEGV